MSDDKDKKGSGSQPDLPDMPGEVSFQDSLQPEQSEKKEDHINLPQTVNDLGMILDIPVTLTLELGSTKINIGDLMRLNKGSIVELEKEASEPLEVMVNGTLIAYAEVVVIHDKYGIRFLDVISESERLKKLA
ncbi:MAG: flagellar motor switch protein FliN [Endozoicomonas sp.]